MKKEKNAKKLFLSSVIYTLLSFLIVYSGTKIYKWQKENNHNNTVKEKLAESVITEDGQKKYTIDFKSLKKQNADTFAWIKVNNTNIEYPIVKSKDNEFYLDHSFDKSSNMAGWIFADFRNKFDGTDKNIVVYGHNRKDRSMFGSLRNVLNSGWYNDEKNHDIIFITQNQNCIYKVFSVYQIEKESYYIKTEFSSNSEFEKFLKTIKSRSIKNFETNVSKKDSILTLSTCAGNDNDRIVLHAKKVI